MRKWLANSCWIGSFQELAHNYGLFAIGFNHLALRPAQALPIDDSILGSYVNLLITKTCREPKQASLRLEPNLLKNHVMTVAVCFTYQPADGFESSFSG